MTNQENILTGNILYCRTNLNHAPNQPINISDLEEYYTDKLQMFTAILSASQNGYVRIHTADEFMAEAKVMVTTTGHKEYQRLNY